MPQVTKPAACGFSFVWCWGSIPEIVLHPPLHRTDKKKPQYQIDSGVSNTCKAYSGSSTWARTRDLRINSPALYQLSY